MNLQNEKVHSMLLALVGGYLLYLAYQLFEKYRTGTKEMPDVVFILAIIVFLVGGIGIFCYAWRIYRKSSKEDQEQSSDQEQKQDNN